MKITKVEYCKTFNLGNYQSAKIGYEVEVPWIEGSAATQSEENADALLKYLQIKVDNEGAKLKK